MPTGLLGYWNPSRDTPTWKTMSRQRRKQWHRENRCRAAQGQPLLPKP